MALMCVGMFSGSASFIPTFMTLRTEDVVCETHDASPRIDIDDALMVLAFS
jgi:hypothetical protein